ncbi:MAG TPA: molybdate ABC transporter substrate-binding protein [Candidatus Dormibacteraeota bacterium]|nr:molybdate ABC transporter substrate-binding protein [Candidatus Dormibacteraeota bacterium]
MPNHRAVILLVAALISACGGSGSGAGAPQTNLTVFAASSLQPAFDQIGAKLLATKNIKTTFNYAESQALTAQLSQRAKADVFASADTANMTTVEKAGLLNGSPQVFAHNRLEIAIAHGNPKNIHSLADLAKPGIVVVLADPSVPAGKYAQEAFAKAHVTVQPASLELQVTSVLSKVAMGQADAGIVYLSDVVSSNRQVDSVTIRDDQNVIADYPIGVLKSASNPDGAAAFVNFLLSADGQTILRFHGFEAA